MVSVAGMLRTQVEAVLERKDTWAGVLASTSVVAMLSMTLRPLKATAKRWRISMSLSAWEQQALDSIRDGLATSDPTLVAWLGMFTRLASGEDMPAGEKIQADSGRATRRSRPNPRYPRRGEVPVHAHWMYQRLGLQRAAVLLWLVITLALIAVALAFNRDGTPGACTGTWATFCNSTSSTTKSAHGIP